MRDKLYVIYYTEGRAERIIFEKLTERMNISDKVSIPDLEHASLHEKYESALVRARDPKKLLEHIRWLYVRYGHRYYLVVSDKDVIVRQYQDFDNYIRELSNQGCICSAIINYSLYMCTYNDVILLLLFQGFRLKSCSNIGDELINVLFNFYSIDVTTICQQCMSNNCCNLECVLRECRLLRKDVLKKLLSRVDIAKYFFKHYLALRKFIELCSNNY